MLDQLAIDLPAQAAEDAQLLRAVLLEMIEAGLDHVRIGVAHAKSRALDGQADPAADSIAYDRTTRAVRRNIMLIQRLHDPAAARAARNRTAARKRILRDVEDTIHREAPDRQDTLQPELLDRLDRLDLEEELDLRPVAEIITDICRDLGIASPSQSPPWKRRTPADLDLLHARAAREPQTPAAREPQTPAAQPEQPERLFHLVATPNGA